MNYDNSYVNAINSIRTIRGLIECAEMEIKIWAKGDHPEAQLEAQKLEAEILALKTRKAELESAD